MSRADQQQIFIAKMIAEMNAKGFINGVYCEHECREDGVTFIIFSLDPRDRDDPYFPVRMDWDDVAYQLRVMGFYDAA